MNMFALKNKMTGRYVAISYDDNDCENGFKYLGKGCASFFRSKADAKVVCERFGKKIKDFELVDYPKG